MARGRKKSPSSDFIKLYRGDYEEISQFVISRTKSNCLLGSGIYLTDDKEIAETYRVKGYSGVDFKKEGLARNRSKSAAMKEARRKFATLVDLAGTIHNAPYRFPFYQLTQNILDKRKGNEILFDGEMVFVDPLLYLKLKNLHNVIIDEVWDASQSELVIQKTCKRRKKRDKHGRYKETPIYEYNVFLPTIPQIGHISTFMFPAYELNNLWTLDYDNPVKNIDILLNLLDEKAKIDTLTRIFTYDICQYIVKASLTRQQLHDLFTSDAFQTIFKNIPLSRFLNCNTEEFRKSAMKLGYIGMQYDGGKILGGKKHNAYIIWDEEIVNHFRVKE